VKILVTNDDGIMAEGLWALVKELKKVAEVVVSAPEKGYFATGMAISDVDRHPLRLKRVQPLVPGIETYCVKGTPADSVILALFKLVKDKISLIISGINHGTNLESDIFASGTIGAALLGYLEGLPALSISLDYGNNSHFDTAAKLAVTLARKIEVGNLPSNIFLDINVPNLPLREVSGIRITCLASGVYGVTVEGGRDRRGVYYRTKRFRQNKATDELTDLWAVQQGYISIVPLHNFICPMFNKPLSQIADTIWSNLFQELQQ
jgi:5'-nucleotidase